MTPILIAGSSHPSLAQAVAEELRTELTPCLLERFPDGEQQVEVQACVRSRAVFLVQPLGPPVGEHLLELLLLADACHRAGAASVAAISPYVGYARQDRLVREGQPLGVRVVAEALGSARLSQLIAVDLHSPVAASCARPFVTHLSAVPALVETLRPRARDDWVVVAPDLGAVKLAEAYARPLGLPLAVVHKLRASGTEVAVQGVVGEVQGKRPLVVDDMISTGATVDAAVEALLAHGCRREVTVAVTHGLFTGRAVERLSRPELTGVLVADGLPPPPRPPGRLEMVRLAPLLAEAVRRIGSARGLGGLLATR